MVRKEKVLGSACCVLRKKWVRGNARAGLRLCNFDLGTMPPSLSSQHPAPGTQHSHRGFTLIELLVVMAIIATLLTLAVPRYFHSTDRAKEAVLKQNLAQMRDSIDKYYGDRGRYPDSLEDLVTRKYLRKVPPDPITESTTTWLTVAPEEAGKGGVFDVRSGATGTALDGSTYEKW
jgi:general secretion pathway protein G